MLAVAVQVFNDNGYEGTSMDDLSRHLGIAKSAIYHHVRSKEDLLRLAVDRALDGLFAVATEAERRPEPAIVRLEFLVWSSVEVLVERLPYVTLLLRVRGNTVTERRALTRRRQFDRLVADLVKQAQGDGDLRDDIDPSVIAHLLFGTVNSIVEWFKPGRAGQRLAANLPQAVTSLAFEGLRIR